MAKHTDAQGKHIKAGDMVWYVPPNHTIKPMFLEILNVRKHDNDGSVVFLKRENGRSGAYATLNENVYVDEPPESIWKPDYDEWCRHCELENN